MSPFYVGAHVQWPHRLKFSDGFSRDSLNLTRSIFTSELESQES